MVSGQGGWRVAATAVGTPRAMHGCTVFVRTVNQRMVLFVSDFDDSDWSSRIQAFKEDANASDTGQSCVHHVESHIAVFTFIVQLLHVHITTLNLVFKLLTSGYIQL